MAAESNATCELLRQLAVSVLRDEGGSLASSSFDRSVGSESAKYVLRDVVNPALCVVCTGAQLNRTQMNYD